MSSSVQVVILISGLAVIFGALITYLLIRYSKISRKIRDFHYYNLNQQRAQIDTLRETLESKIYELTNRLVATDDRWRDVHHLLISSQKPPRDLSGEPGKVYLTEFLRSKGITEEDLEVDRDFVLLLTPFHEEHFEEYIVIREACHRVGLRCLRGDEEFVRDDIFSHILRLMSKARIVIANINGRNPNVFLELGVAYAMDKGIILVSKSGKEAPADVKSQRMIIYQSLHRLELELQHELTKLLVRM